MAGTGLTFVAIDIETTGLTPVVARIVEIGAVKFRNGRELGTFEQLVNPAVPIPAGATAVNGITDRMVQGMPAIEDVLPEFLDFVGDAVPVAHHAPFDAAFLEYDLSRLGLSLPHSRVLDTCVIGRMVFPGLRSYSLENLTVALCIGADGLHRALADARACMMVLLRCLQRLGRGAGTDLEDLLTASGTVFDPEVDDAVFDGPLRPLKEALENGLTVEIVYCDARGRLSRRIIRPLQVGKVRGAIMMEAYCHALQDKRNFRLDRIVEVK